MNIDGEAIVFLWIFKLKHEKEKKYSNIECKHNIAYIFENEKEFRNYFISNGFIDIEENILRCCRMKTTKKGSIIALKGLCDHAITRHLEINNKHDIKLNNAKDILNKFSEDYNNDNVKTEHIIMRPKEPKYNDPIITDSNIETNSKIVTDIFDKDETICDDEEEKRFDLINRNKLKILTTNFRNID